MIINNPPRLPSSRGVSKYIQTELFSWLRNFVAGVNGRMNFNDNFASFLAKDIVIAAGAQASIPNALAVIPNERTIVRQLGDGVITDAVWDVDTLRVVNNGAVEVTIDVRFFHNYQS